MNQRLNTQQGFTLIEAMVVLGILALIGMIAVPAYDSLMRRYESQMVGRHVQEALRRAKIEAALHQKDVIICPINASEVCDRFGQSGLMVFIDKNKNNRKDDSDPLVLKESFELNYGMLSMTVALHRHYIKFMGDNAKPRGHMGNVRYCALNGDAALSHQTTINMHGLSRIEHGDVIKISC
ncbi:GspH/FimT family pseudopilin [Moraxella canis]|uniref:Type II secretion system protein H n=1 Tax=Moraxella canis TaxID=90239 RepID=A0ABZ0WWG8_9GAMM|nr:GspH/FimT family pseudopilin [Moraxella canis]WQE03412.1 GspH/FimT family pseudopilin [Moraxella canis]